MTPAEGWWKSQPPTDLEVNGSARLAEAKGLLEDAWVIHFAWPKNPLPMNGSRGNRRAAAAQEARIRDQVQQRVMLARVPRMQRCGVLVTWWVNTATVRDPDNLARLEKRMFDAIVRAGVVADDRPALMVKPRAQILDLRTEPRRWVTKPCFTLTIVRLDDIADTDPMRGVQFPEVTP